MHRFIIDSDGSNVFCCYDPLDREAIRRYVAAIPPKVTTVLICPNWIGKFMYPAKVGETCPRDPLRSVLERGDDPFGWLIDDVRAAGKEIFITYRTNDVHEGSDLEFEGHSEFRKQHPDYMVDPENARNNWMASCLDYSRPEVRRYVLASVADLAERYDVDGFQLDWMRFPRHLSGATDEEVWAKRDALTEFMAEVRAVLDRVGGERGKRILLAPRVPTWPAGCRKLGVDLAEWNRRGLMDFVTAAPFLSTDFTMPFRQLRTVLGARAIPLYAGADFCHSGRPHGPESLRAWALCMYAQGADGLNVFNFPCWTEYLGAVPYHWLEGFESAETLRGRAALYTLITGHHRVPEVDQPTPLPVELPPGESVTLALYLPPSAVPAARATALACACGEVGLAINGAPVPSRLPRAHNLLLTHMNADILGREPKRDECRLFDLDPAVLRGGENEVALRNMTETALTLIRFDLALWY